LERIWLCHTGDVRQYGMAKEGLIDLVEGLIAGALLEVFASTNSS
jgi:hypothetical protein